MGRRRIGGEMPPEKDFFKSAEASYKDVPPNELDGFTLIASTPTLKVYRKDKTLLIGVRGTKLTDKQDLIADARIPLNLLKHSDRYKRDKDAFEKVVKQFPPQDYEYYISGHSLGGAIDNQLKYDFPFIRNAVEYNPAFQPKDVFYAQGPDIKRIYTDKDGLYQLGGKLFINKKVIPTKSSIGNSYVDAVSGHILSNFADLYSGGVSGGGQTGSKIAKELNRYDLFYTIMFALDKIRRHFTPDDLKMYEDLIKLTEGHKSVSDTAQEYLLERAKYLYEKYIKRRGGGDGYFTDKFERGFQHLLKDVDDIDLKNEIEDIAIELKDELKKVGKTFSISTGYNTAVKDVKERLVKKALDLIYKRIEAYKKYESKMKPLLLAHKHNVAREKQDVLMREELPKGKKKEFAPVRPSGSGKNAGFIKMLYAKKVLKRTPDYYPTRDKKAPKKFEIKKIKNPSSNLKKKFGVAETTQRVNTLNRPFKKGERKDLNAEQLTELRRLERERKHKSLAKKEGITLEEYYKRHKIKGGGQTISKAGQLV